MKLSAYFVNTSRGQLIDEMALVDVLQRHVIAGAGLDVYETESYCRLIIHCFYLITWC